MDGFAVVGGIRRYACAAFLMLAGATAVLPSTALANHVQGATYTGTHVGGGTVSFTVTPDGSGISRFGATTIPGQPSCTFNSLEVTFTTPVPIVGHSFSRTVGTGLSFSGSFPGIGSASGTLRATSSTPPCDSGTISWNAAAPAVNIVETSGTTAVSESGAADIYSVVLTTQPSANVTVSINPDAQVTRSPSSLTFTPANWNVPQSVSVGAVDDTVTEPSPHPGTITHSATSSDSAYNGIGVRSVSVSITDNDLSSQCSDGIDNDGDGKVDFPVDPGCTSAADNDEFDVPPPPACPDPSVASHHVYRGTHSAGGLVCFTVSPDWSGVSTFHAEQIPGDTCNFVFVRRFFTSALPINNRSFNTAGGSIIDSLNGSFPSGRGAQGTFRARRSGGGPFLPSCDTGFLNWSASTNDTPPWALPVAAADKTAPGLVLTARSVQRAIRQKGILVEVACPTESCTATAQGSVSAPGAARTYRLKAATKQLARGGKAKLKLRFSKPALKAVKRALRKRKKVEARVTVTAKDAAGNAAVQKRRIKLRR